MTAKWDAAQMPSQKGKIAIVTGANSGIGFFTALELARHGAQVILACRNEEKTTAAVDKIQAELEVSPEAGAVEFMQLDVSSLSSVKAFVDAFKTRYDRLDLLINNAGIIGVPYTETADGLELQMATNHFGHFALTAQLFERLQQSSGGRIVNVSSIFHRLAIRYNEDTVMRTKAKYGPSLSYHESKLANLLFTKELARRLQAKGIRNVVAVACHPGFSDTNLSTTPIENGGFLSAAFQIGIRLPIFQSASMGALPTLYAATIPNVESGEFYGPDGFATCWGHLTLETPTAYSRSEPAARKLWEVSERLTRTTFPVDKITSANDSL